MSQKPPDPEREPSTSSRVTPDSQFSGGTADARARGPAASLAPGGYASLMLSAISEAVIAADFQGNILHWNPAAEDFYGWPAEEAMGGNLLELIRSEPIRSSAAQALETMRERDTWTREITVQRKDGSEFPAQVTLSQIQDEQGAPIGVVAVLTDLTERNRIERERQLLLSGAQGARIQAADLQTRAERLLEITAAYSRARTPDEVDKVTMEVGVAALGANAGSILLTNASGDALDLVETTGDAPHIECWRDQAVPLDAGLPFTDAVLRQESIWISGREEMLERYPAISALDAADQVGVVALPLIASGRTFGVIVLSYAPAREFPADERVFAETVAGFCAQALERAWLFARERGARLEADAAQRRAAGLLRVTAALSRALTPQEVCTVAINQGLEALDIDAGLVALSTPDGSELTITQSSGYPTDIIDRWSAETIPIDLPLPLTDAVRTGEPLWIRSRDEMLERYPSMVDRPPVVSEAFAAIPLSAGTRRLGALGLTYRAAGDIAESERTYILTLARLCSQALERAYLFAAERDARVEAEQAQQRLSLLAEAGELFISSPDMNDTLTAIARLIVPKVADWCAIDTVGDGGLPERITVMHVDPEKVRWADELRRHVPFDPQAPGGLARVLRTGEPVFYPVITDDMLVALARDDEQLKLIRAVGFSSALIVPLIARGRTLGAITLVHAESERHYTAEDLALTENLAYRAALALDNARLYEQAQEHALRKDALASVSQAFAEASLDLTAVLETCSREVAQLVGDSAIIRLPSEDGLWLHPVAIYHRNPEAETALCELHAENPLRWGEGITGQVATTGEPLLIPETSPDEMFSIVKPAYRTWSQKFGMYGVLIVPMSRGKQVVGTIALFRSTPGRPYTEADKQFVQEIADRAAMAVENAQLYRQAQRAVQLREEFLSIASHEIRTPLTTITGFAHLLTRQLAQDTINPERIDSVTTRLLHEAQRLSQIVTDLLDVSRIQQGHLDLRPEPCDLSSLAHQVVDRLSIAQERDNRREIVVQAPAPVVGEWDAARLDQVLTNLLSNALKYSLEGPIQVTVEQDGASAVLTVRDQGVGIPEDQQAKLFEPFVRGDTAHHSSGGAGLGLYITRQIVEGHQGTIDLRSRPGDGAVFTVRLPIQVAE